MTSSDSAWEEAQNWKDRAYAWEGIYKELDKQVEPLARFVDWCLNGEGASFEFAPEELEQEARTALTEYNAGRPE